MFGAPHGHLFIYFHGGPGAPSEALQAGRKLDCRIAAVREYPVTLLKSPSAEKNGVLS